MKRPCRIALGTVIVCLFLIVTVVADTEVSAEDNVFHFVFFNPDNEAQDPITAVSAMKPFADYIGEEIGMELKVHYLIRKKDLEHILSKYKVGMGLFDPIFAIQNRERLGLEPFLIPVMAGDESSYYHIYVVAKKEDGYKSLEDLAGKKFAYTALEKSNHEYLNKIVFQGKLEILSFFSEIIQVTTPSSAVMSVVYGEVDCAGVSFGRFETMKELNPMIGRELEVVYKSPKITVAPMCYFKNNTTPELRKKLEDMLMVMHESALGQQTLMPFRVLRFNRFSYDRLKSMEDLLALAKVQAASSGKKPGGAKATTTKITKALPAASEGVSFKRITHKYLANDNAVRISARLNSSEALDKVELIYQMAGQDKKTVAMQKGKTGSYSARVKLPEKSSSGEEKEVVYTVKSGDTLGKISKKYYGEIKKWIMIFTYNDLKNPNMIFVGQKLRIKLSGQFENVLMDVWIKGTTTSGKITVSNKKDVLITR